MISNNFVSNLMLISLQIIYAWARDAPKLELPEGVGFKVGGDSPIQYLVLQVHYATVQKFQGILVFSIIILNLLIYQSFC